MYVHRLETETTYTRCHAKSEAEKTRKSQIIQELSGKVNNSKKRTEALTAEVSQCMCMTSQTLNLCVCACACVCVLYEIGTCNSIVHTGQELDYTAGTQRLMAHSEELEEELSSATAKHEECRVKCEEEHAILKVLCLQAV